MKASTIMGVIAQQPDPWKIIGWGVLLVIACFAVALVATIIAGLLIAMAKRKTKRKIALNTPPATGQVWDQNGKFLHIYDVLGGRVYVRTTGVSWSESIEEWNARVRNRNLTLEARA